MKDRIPKHPGRVELKPVAGQENTYDMTMADEAIENGTPPIKRHLLPDDVAQRIGGETPPYDVGEALDKMNSFLPTETIYGVPIEELKATVDSLPRLLNRNIVVNTLPGTTDDVIDVSDFFGGGTLTINGAATATTTHTVRRFVVARCTNSRVIINGFNCSITDNNSVDIFDSFHVHITNMHLTSGTNTTTTNRGVLSNRCKLVVVNLCTISNKNEAVRSLLTLMFETHTLSGAGNNIVYMADIASNLLVRTQGTIAGNRFCLEANSGRLVMGTSITWSTTMANLQNALDGIPVNIGRFNFAINVAAGTLNAALTLTDRSGTGRITINGAATRGTTHTLVSAAFARLSCALTLRGFNLTSSNTACVDLWQCEEARIYDCRMVNGSSATTQNVGVVTGRTLSVQTEACEISNKHLAISASHNSQHISSNNVGSNNHIVHAVFLGTIRRAGSQPTGTTATSVGAGGQII